MALAAIGAALYGIEFIFEGLATLIETGAALDIAGLGETVYEFGEGELALFSDFGENSAELGESIREGAKTVAGYASKAKTVVNTTDRVVKKVQSGLRTKEEQ